MKNTSSTRTVGLDLGDRKHSVCVLDARGEILKQEAITNTRPSLAALSKRHPGALMVMPAAFAHETGTLGAAVPAGETLVANG